MLNKDNNYWVTHTKQNVESRAAHLPILFFFDESCEAWSEGLEHILWMWKENDKEN